MNFKIKLQKSLNSHFDPLLKQISDYYEISFEELKAVTEELISIPTVCTHRFKSGKNKGKHCDVRPLQNGYCKTHQKYAINIGGSVGNTNSTSKTPSKTRQQVIDWLNTAVPQEETILKKCQHGLIHEESEIIFSPNFVVMGRLNKNKIDKLSHFEVEMCEKRGWEYSMECVYPE